MLWTAPGGTFGQTDHFDQLCHHTLSMQHQGIKRWALWAPWQLPATLGDSKSGDSERDRADKAKDGHTGIEAHAVPHAGEHASVISHIRAHTRFEASVRPGDVLFYPPAWFHATIVEPGEDSITAAIDLESYPAFGALKHPETFMDGPFGFGACRRDWSELSTIWDRVLLNSGGT